MNSVGKRKRPLFSSSEIFDLFVFFNIRSLGRWLHYSYYLNAFNLCVATLIENLH